MRDGLLARDQSEQLGFFAPSQPASPDAQRLNLLALSRVKGLGEASLKALVRAFHDLDAVWEATPDELSQVLSGSRFRAHKDVVDQIITRQSDLREAASRDLEGFRRQGIRLVTVLDAEFPDRLRDIKDPPQWLFVQGSLDVLSIPNLVAVVGTRQASAQGIERARSVSRWLAEKGFGIVSGLAEGIDQAAHETALDYDAPTIGVMGTGILVVFPASTSHVRRQIVAQGGAIITEYLPSESYSRTRFVRRNRILAGLAYATVPIEGRPSSGTAHTYRFARDFGRVAFGVIRSSKPTENGILQLLSEDGRPVFDLDSPQKMSELEALLTPALQDAPATRVQGLSFRTLVDEFERLLESHPVTKQDLDQLKTELDAKWKRANRGRQSGNPRP